MSVESARQAEAHAIWCSPRLERKAGDLALGARGSVHVPVCVCVGVRVNVCVFNIRVVIFPLHGPWRKGYR